ncbi:MAG: rhomboid family intramembrane serine protease [Hyphomicrobiaceae bacterium]|nr:rhomboid family intramembrane serine protease [Hyphomicrobiaceae bacterium]
MNGRQPIFNIPASVVWLLVIMAGMHLLRSQLPSQVGEELLLTLAFIPARYVFPAPNLPGGEWADVTSFVTYMLVHGDATHLIVNSVWMLAFGSAVAKRVGSLRFILFSTLCGVAGALAHLALHFGELVPVVGASAAISGQMAAAIRFMFGASRQIIPSAGDLAFVPLASIWQTLTDLRFLAFLTVWIALNMLFGLGGVDVNGAGSSIAWEAHIGGFLCGLFAFGLFDRSVRRRDGFV